MGQKLVNLRIFAIFLLKAAHYAQIDATLAYREKSLYNFSFTFSSI
jgi:hypothetical protein